MGMMMATPVTVFGAEGGNDYLDVSSGTVQGRAVTIKQWFKGVPPKNYRGKQRIDYYKSPGGGYIGVYL